MLNDVPAFFNDGGKLNDGVYLIPNDQLSISFRDGNGAFSGLSAPSGGLIFNDDFCDNYHRVILA